MSAVLCETPPHPVLEWARQDAHDGARRLEVPSGYEGEPNEAQQSRTGDGWRFSGKPWIQD
jgi:hypothetical protein